MSIKIIQTHKTIPPAFCHLWKLEMSIFESKMNGGLGKGTRGVLRKKTWLDMTMHTLRINKDKILNLINVYN